MAQVVAAFHWRVDSRSDGLNYYLCQRRTAPVGKEKWNQLQDGSLESMEQEVEKRHQC